MSHLQHRGRQPSSAFRAAPAFDTHGDQHRISPTLSNSTCRISQSFAFSRCHPLLAVRLSHVSADLLHNSTPPPSESNHRIRLPGCPVSAWRDSKAHDLPGSILHQVSDYWITPATACYYSTQRPTERRYTFKLSSDPRFPQVPPTLSPSFRYSGTGPSCSRLRIVELVHFCTNSSLRVWHASNPSGIRRRPVFHRLSVLHRAFGHFLPRPVSVSPNLLCSTAPLVVSLQRAES